MITPQAKQLTGVCNIYEDPTGIPTVGENCPSK